MHQILKYWSQSVVTIDESTNQTLEQFIVKVIWTSSVNSVDLFVLFLFFFNWFVLGICSRMACYLIPTELLTYILDKELRNIVMLNTHRRLTVHLFSRLKKVVKSGNGIS